MSFIFSNHLSPTVVTSICAGYFYTVTIDGIVKLIIDITFFFKVSADTVIPVYNDQLMGYFSAFWGSSRWPTAT